MLACPKAEVILVLLDKREIFRAALLKRLRGVAEPYPWPTSARSAWVIAACRGSSLLRSRNERSEFLTIVAPKLVDAAKTGMNLAFLTGNSMKELSERFLKWLIQHLCHDSCLRLLSQFHFFCNSGGVYAHFSADYIEELLQSRSENCHDPEFVYTSLTFDGLVGRAIRPQFIDAAYVEQCQMPEAELHDVTAILADEATRYHNDICGRREELGRLYDLKWIRDEKSGDLRRPELEIRTAQYGTTSNLKQAIVQVTLKPILSIYQALEGQKPKLANGQDLRTSLATQIQEALGRRGFDQFTARPGGRSSIDLTLGKLDKAYALEFIIDRLNVQGASRLGEKIGTNTIYFGDEVIVGGGNDYPVTRIPGLLVFAVNPDPDLVPIHSSVLVPSTIRCGPSATAEVLEGLNSCASELQLKFKSDRPTNTAVKEFKVRLFSRRIKEKIEDLRPSTKHSVRDWQALHALVTLMCRDDKASKEWLSILVEELDGIMTHLASQKAPTPPAIGSSHPDGSQQT